MLKERIAVHSTMKLIHYQDIYFQKIKKQKKKKKKKKEKETPVSNVSCQ
jgi:hypothetical protein